jgi:CheY-like chemotaxis protein
VAIEKVILLIEDNDAHAEMAKRSFRKHPLPSRVETATDGQEALDYLYRKGEYEDGSRAPRPDMILLDLRLPRVDGLDVLKTIKQDPALWDIPVIVLTTSDAESDIQGAYGYHANSYLVKPINFKDFTAMMETLGYYWLQWNRQSRS